MSSTIGSETAFGDMVTNLITLERDALAAYETCLEKLTHPALKEAVEDFRQDHLRHIETLTEIARQAGAEAPAEGDARELLTTGKVSLGAVIGESAVLKAMRTNEDETVAAYERAAQHPDLLPKTKVFFARALSDEQRHRNWMKRTADAL